jgi:hypothetical protein
MTALSRRLLSGPARAGLPLPDLHPEHVRERLQWSMRSVPFPPSPVPLHPVLLPGREYDELHEAAVRVIGVLVRVAYHLGRTREERLAALGLDPRACPLFTDNEPWEWRYAACNARPDAFITPEGVKIIECNSGGGVGAVVQTQLLAGAWVDAIYSDAPLRAHRPYAVRADMFDRMCRHEETDRSVVFLGSVKDLVRGVTSTRYFDTEIDYLRGRGFTAEFFEPTDLMAGLIEGTGRLRYAVGLRHFTVHEWTQLGIDWGPVGEALAAGCQLVASQTSALLGNKKLLGLASEGQPCMTAEDRRLIDRYVPWTRVAGDRDVTYRGRRYSLTDLVTGHQERFLLKGATGMKGEEVLMGRDTDRRAWHDAVREAVRDGNSIVQERVESLRYPMTSLYPDGTTRTELVAPVLGANVIGGRPAGCLARYFPDGADSVISVERHGGAQNVAVAVG